MLLAVATEPFSDWLTQAPLSPGRLTPEQRGLLQAAFRFRPQQGTDYYAAGHRLPWLENRRLVMSLTPRHQQRDRP